MHPCECRCGGDACTLPRHGACRYCIRIFTAKVREDTQGFLCEELFDAAEPAVPERFKVVPPKLLGWRLSTGVRQAGRFRDEQSIPRETG